MFRLKDLVITVSIGIAVPYQDSIKSIGGLWVKILMFAIIISILYIISRYINIIKSSINISPFTNIMLKSIIRTLDLINLFAITLISYVVTARIFIDYSTFNLYDIELYILVLSLITVLCTLYETYIYITPKANI